MSKAPQKTKRHISSLALGWLSALLVYCLLCNVVFAEFIVSHRAPEAASDKREDYSAELIALALEKTQTKYGSYKLQTVPPMNIKRSVTTVAQNIYPNLLIEMSYDKQFTTSTELTYIDFPIELGITGVRVCFINPAIKEKLRATTSLEALKHYTIIQGIGWADTDILRSNGFKVIEVGSYEGLFKMVTAGRVDLFCRGANELLNEYKTFSYIKGLSYDESFAIVYPLPRFFFLSRNNQLAKKRIEEGLKLAYEDGSLRKLWNKHYSQSVAFAKLKQRKIFRIPNPLMKDLSDNYKHYAYDPGIEQ